MFDTVPVLKVAAPVAHIRLCAPQRHNALSMADIAAFAGHLGQVREMPELRVLIVSAGGRSFCSGHDLGHFDPARAAEVPPPVEFERLADGIEAMPIPTVCALQGSVHAGGIDLALACDFRIGVAGMVASMPAARIGIHLYPGALRRYAAQLGPSAAKRFCLLGATLPAEELLHVGFLDALVAPDALENTVAGMADTLAANAPIAVRGMKAGLDAYARGDPEADTVSRTGFLASFRSTDVLEGLQAMKEKRRPVFTGR